MAEILIPARGCVYIPRKNGGAGGGFYSLDPDLKGTDSAPIVLEGVDGLEGDLVTPTVTLEGKKILYVFGEDFGSVSIAGMALLGRAEEGGKTFQKVVSYFQDNRVGVRDKPVTVSYPGGVSQKVYLTHLVIARPDPQFHIQMFQMRAVVAEPSNP